MTWLPYIGYVKIFKGEGEKKTQNEMLTLFSFKTFNKSRMWHFLSDLVTTLQKIYHWIVYAIYALKTNNIIMYFAIIRLSLKVQPCNINHNSREFDMFPVWKSNILYLKKGQLCFFNQGSCFRLLIVFHLLLSLNLVILAVSDPTMGHRGDGAFQHGPK